MVLVPGDAGDGADDQVVPGQLDAEHRVAHLHDLRQLPALLGVDADVEVVVGRRDADDQVVLAVAGQIAVVGVQDRAAALGRGVVRGAVVEPLDGLLVRRASERSYNPGFSLKSARTTSTGSTLCRSPLGYVHALDLARSLWCRSPRRAPRGRAASATGGWGPRRSASRPRPQPAGVAAARTTSAARTAKAAAARRLRFTALLPAGGAACRRHQVCCHGRVRAVTTRARSA